MEEKPSIFLNLVFLVAATNQQGNGSLKHRHFAQFNSCPPVLLHFSSFSKPNQGSDAVSNAFRMFPPSTRSLAGDLFFYMMCFQQNIIISAASTSMRQWFKAASWVDSKAYGIAYYRGTFEELDTSSDCNAVALFCTDIPHCTWAKKGHVQNMTLCNNYSLKMKIFISL